MAYYKITTDKSGNLKAKIQIYERSKDDQKGKVITKTIYNTKNLDRSKFKMEIAEYAAVWEKSVATVKEVSGRDEVLSFPKLMAEWVADVKANLSDSYYLRAIELEKKFNNFLKKNKLYNVPVTEIHVRHIQMFLNSFAGKVPAFSGMVELKDDLPEKVDFKKLQREGVVNRCTRYNLEHRGTICKKTAMKICNYFGIDFDDYFQEKVILKQYAQETIKGFRRLLRTVFNEAVRYEWINRNPVCGTKIKTRNMNISFKEVTEKTVFSKIEAQQFLRSLDNLDYESMNKKIMVKLMLLTGIRNAELHGLKWTDIDFENKIIHIRRNRMYSPRLGIYEKCPKTKTSERDIPLPMGLAYELEEYKKWFRLVDEDFDNKLDEYYIAANYKREPEAPDCIGVWLRKYEKAHGFKNVTCHGLRHTYCSLLLAENVPIQTVSKYMGHSDSSVTLQVYTHFIPDTMEKVVDVLNDIEYGSKEKSFYS